MMTKAEILKQTGLSEEEFYKKFPTQESFQEFYKGGKLPKAALGALLGTAVQKEQQLRGLQSAGLTAAAGGIDKLTENKNESTQLFGSTASGAARGAASGAMFGPVGIGVGAVIGGASGYVQGQQERRADALQDKNQAFTANLNEQAANIAKAQTGTDTSGYGVGQMKYGGMFKYGMGGPMYEAEGGEVLQSNNLSSLYGGGNLQENSSNAIKLEGPSHEQGGMPMSTNGEGRIFSDRLKPKGNKKQTFADLADIYTKEIGKIEETEKKNPGEAAKNTSKYMKKDLNFKLNALFEAQETQKADKEEKKAIREFKKGGWIKYAPGGEIDLTRRLTPQQLEEINRDAFYRKADEDFMRVKAMESVKEMQNIPNQGYSDPTSGMAYDASGDMDTDMTATNMDNISALEAAQSVAPITEDQTFADNIGFNLFDNVDEFGNTFPSARDINRVPFAPPGQAQRERKFDNSVSDIEQNIDLEDEAYPSNETDYYSGNTFGLPGLGVRKPLSPDAGYQAPLFNYDDMMNNALNGVMLPQDIADEEKRKNTPITMDVMGAANIPSMSMGDMSGSELINEPEGDAQILNNEDPQNSKTPGMTPSQMRLASAAPQMVSNLYRGLFGQVDQPFLGRASAMPGGAQALREAGEYTAYNPAAELAANQAAAGRARAQMGRTGNLAAMMQGNLAAGRMEGQGASQILGGAERMNVQAANRAQDRQLGMRQQLMQDAKQTELFNLQQRMREQDMYRQNQGAKDAFLQAGLGQISQVGNVMASDRMQSKELAELMSKLG